eukprot:6213910-Pleurochrysis_carterae.AAC.2
MMRRSCRNLNAPHPFFIELEQHAAGECVRNATRQLVSMQDMKVNGIRPICSMQTPTPTLRPHRLPNARSHSNIGWEMCTGICYPMERLPDYLNAPALVVAPGSFMAFCGSAPGTAHVWAYSKRSGAVL